MSASLLEARDLSVTIGRTALLTDINLELHAGEVLAVVGENGAGKSTLLRALSGELRPSSGHVTLGGLPLVAYSALELARRRAVLSQDHHVSFSFTALEVARMGRHPYGEANASEIALEALRLCDAAHLETRVFATLSGGERQRARLAQLAVQAPRIALLDEPLTHLDPAHQARLLAWARGEADAGRSVVLTLHDPNWAACHCDRLLFLHGDGRWQLGTPADLLTPAALEALYGPGTAALWQQKA